ncbi:hypothetical protein PIB30_003628 [Stylosanthes scabra]|uniref:ENT domain-containing protein n=1 Tax=Stylosanthes scabra TaxID=79078 RepID=A0ABU6Y0S7_9FABA|nr:hypothetical protein [Stylosanthes scabra]
MEAQIHQLEQEAYSAVLRAFKAQSDALTWEKEGLITELRKELRVSDDEHRELLNRVNADEIIHRIREWRQTGLYQPARRSASQPIHDILPSPSISASKKLKTSHSVPLSHGQSLPTPSLVRPGPYPSAGPTGARHFMSRSSSNALASNVPNEPASYDPLIGKKVWTRWPEDNHFYEAVITDYSHTDGRHALVYDINTANETWEWVDLKEESEKSLKCSSIDHTSNYVKIIGNSGQGRGVKKFFSRGGDSLGAGRGRGPKQLRKEFPPRQNGVGKRVLDDIELLNTESLVKEVERVFAASPPDSLELEKAKKMLKEHEQALMDAISKIADASEGQSGSNLMCT